MKNIKTATAIFMLALFAAYHARAALPAGFVELEAIQGDGTAAYIRTDYVPNPLTDRLEMKFRCDTSKSAAFFCARNTTAATADSWTLFYLANASPILRFDYSASQTSQNTSLSSMQVVELSVASNVVTFAGGSTLTANVPCDPAFVQAGSPMFLFASTVDGSTANSNYAKHILYSFKVYRSGELIHDYVPAKRSSDSKIGLYDAVTGDFFTNANSSGSFTSIYHRLYHIANASLESGNASSLSGDLDGSTPPTGWADSSNSATRIRNGITGAYEKYYFWCTNRTGAIHQLRTRAVSNKGSYATPATSEIIFLPNSYVYMFNKSCGTNNTDGSVATLTFNNTTLLEGSCLDFQCNQNGRYTYVTQVGGSFDIKEDAALKFTSRGGSGTGDTPCGVVKLTATVMGKGTIESKLLNNSTAVTTSTAKFNQSITGDLSGFTGDLVVYRANLTYPGDLVHELVNANSIPADPAPGETAYVVVTNGATLIVDHDWTSGANRIWNFGDGARPTVSVAEGKTVTIKGDLCGSAGFLKRGLGTLVLSGSVSNFSGTCEVLSGKVVLKGGAADLKHRCFRAKNAMVLPSGYTMLDYLHLSGGGADSYIDTGFTPTTGTFGFLFDYYIDKELVAGVGANTRVMGSGTAFGKGIMLGIAVTDLSADNGNLAFGQTNVKVASSASGGQVGYSRMRMSIVRGEAELSRGWRYSFAGDASTYYGSVYLGTFHTQSQAAGAPLRIYRFKVFEGLTLVNDFVPVRTSGGAVGLYDTYGNLGFRQAAAAQYVSAGPAYSGSDKEWIEVLPGSVYYLR